MSDIETAGEIIRDDARGYAEIKVDREELVAVEFRYGPGESGPSAHIHREHSDCFYVTEGELAFELGGERVLLSAGGFVLVPPGVVHTFRNEGPASARFLNQHVPGCRFADYLRGEDVDFDQDEPPEDGGLPVSEAIVVPPPAR